MRERLPLGLSAAALVVALLGATPLGNAARQGIAKVVPYAKVAGFAQNAGKLNGHTSAATPRAGQIPVLDSTGKLPASIGAVGPKGDQGPPGGAGVTALQVMTKQISAGAGTTTDTIECSSGKSVLGGGFRVGGDLQPLDSWPATDYAWRVRVTNRTGANATAILYAVCAKVGS
jgi:hypothetical protein